MGLLVAQAATPLMKDWVLVIGAPAAQVPLLLPLPQLLPLLPLLRTLLLLLLQPLLRDTGKRVADRRLHLHLLHRLVLLELKLLRH